MNIKSVIENNDTLAGRVFDSFIQVMIIISIVTFSVETLPDLSEGTLEILSILEKVIVAIFTLEYLARVFVAKKKREYIFSFYGMVDFISVAPFYLFLGFDFRPLRILRLMRLFRIFKLVRFNKAMRRLGRAIEIAKEEFVLFVMITVMLLYLTSVGIYYFEHSAQPEQFKSIFHSMWWAVATLTTVGYGDIYPVTAGGKIFTFLVLMIGLGIVAVPAGLISSALSKARQEEKESDR